MLKNTVSKDFVLLLGYLCLFSFSQSEFTHRLIAEGNHIAKG